MEEESTNRIVTMESVGNFLKTSLRFSVVIMAIISFVYIFITESF
jgi:hypothetical protein